MIPLLGKTSPLPRILADRPDAGERPRILFLCQGVPPCQFNPHAAGGEQPLEPWSQGLSKSFGASSERTGVRGGAGESPASHKENPSEEGPKAVEENLRHFHDYRNVLSSSRNRKRGEAQSDFSAKSDSGVQFPGYQKRKHCKSPLTAGLIKTARRAVCVEGIRDQKFLEVPV